MADRTQIKEHMKVSARAANRRALSDELEGARIKLTRSGAADDRHHYLDMDMADPRVENHLYLKIDTAEASQKAQDN